MACIQILFGSKRIFGIWTQDINSHSDVKSILHLVTRIYRLDSGALFKERPVSRKQPCLFFSQLSEHLNDDILQYNNFWYLLCQLPLMGAMIYMDF